MFESIKKKIALSRLRKTKEYQYWNHKNIGERHHELRRGAGYYNTYGTEEFMMESGLTGLYDCVECVNWNDPKDMIQYSWWNFIGYKGYKPIKECTFDEFKNLYIDILFKNKQNTII